MQSSEDKGSSDLVARIKRAGSPQQLRRLAREIPGQAAAANLEAILVFLKKRCEEYNMPDSEGLARLIQAKADVADRKSSSVSPPETPTL